MIPRTLDEVLAPMASSEFLRRSWGQRFEYIAGHPGKFSDLLPWSALNRILQEHEFNGTRLSLVRDGEPLPFPSSSPTRTNGRIDPVVLTKQLRAGASLIINGIHQLYRPIEEVRAVLARALEERIGVNMYAGWRTTKGFDLHWDNHDVLVLQIAGRKQWKVFGDNRPHPISYLLDGDYAPPQEPVWEGIIEAGDLMYIPRGWWHVAVPLDEPSLHLTFGIYRRTGRDLLLWLVDEATKASASVRQDLPRHASETEQRAFADRLRNDLLALWRPDLVDAYLTTVDSSARATVATSLPWAAMPEGLPPTDDYRLEMPVAREIRFEVLPETEKVQFVANGRRWRFPLWAMRIVELLKNGPVSIADLCAAVPDQIGRDAVRKLLAGLVAEGLLQIVEPDALPATTSSSAPSAGEALVAD